MFTRRLWLIGVFLLTGTTTAAAQPAVPLVHFTRTASSCGAIFPGIPGANHVCIQYLFDESDLWIYRGGTAQSIRTMQQSCLGGQEPCPPFVSSNRQIVLTAAQRQAVNDALADASIGLATGDCNPLPHVDPIPNIPLPVVNGRIVWFGNNFRHTALSLGVDFPDLCPEALSSLFVTLTGLSPAAGSAAAAGSSGTEP
jgi:hypothetical protein